jgi:hypothetical protein
MLDKSPARVGQAAWTDTAETGRQTRDSLIETQMSAAAAKKIQNVFPQGFVRVHLRLHWVHDFFTSTA